MKVFEQPSVRKALWQIGNTFLPYAGLWVVMVVLLERGLPFWVILPLIVLASFLQVRLFIFFHDCCHGSFLRSPGANRAVGFVTGVLTFTAFNEFRHTHGVHHSSAGNLDRRGIGDVWTMTVDEYRASDLARRINYRIYRHPLILFGLGPVFLFLVSNRIPHRLTSPERVRSILVTNAAILAVATAISLASSLSTYLLIQLPVLAAAGIMGIWLFYVQHQFDPSYWARAEQWSYTDAALQGSSYYALPRVLQWLSGNIGLHHVHHLRPRIPNYNLQSCLDSITELRVPRPLTLRRSLRSMGLNLWDERRGRLVRFAALRRGVPAAP